MDFSGFEVLSTIHEQMKQLKELPERFGSCRLILTTFIGCKYRPCDMYVPDNVEKIDAGAFEDCRNLRNIRLPMPAANVAQDAFAGFHCKTLRLPKTLKKIQAKAFINSDIREIVLPDSVSSVDNAAFAYCGSERIVLSPSLKKIQPHVFDGCPNLKELVLPTGVETLNLSAISDCPRLKKLTLPPSLKEILSFGTGYVSAIEEIVNLSPLPVTKAQFPKLKRLKTSPDD